MAVNYVMERLLQSFPRQVAGSDIISAGGLSSGRGQKNPCQKNEGILCAFSSVIFGNKEELCQPPRLWSCLRRYLQDLHLCRTMQYKQDPLKG